MSKYLLVESRDPFETPDSRQLLELADSLGREGNEVTVYLIQNAVLATRSAAKVEGLDKLLVTDGVQILADDYSLQERGIDGTDLAAGVGISNMDQLVDLIVEGGPKVVWH